MKCYPCYGPAPFLSWIALPFVIITAPFAAITEPGNGNPLVPGFFADPFVFYSNDTFYIFSTTDGYDDGSFMFFGPFGVWHSTDFVNWRFKTLAFPADFPYQGSRLWAPSVRGARTESGICTMYGAATGATWYPPVRRWGRGQI